MDKYDQFDHYMIEKTLADKLMRASKSQRRMLYTQVYDELLQKVPQLARKKDPHAARRKENRQLRLLKFFLKPDSTFLEIGPGDCALAMEVSKRVKKVHVVDVSSERIRNTALPDNFEFLISDGSSIPVPDNSIDIAYSNQLIEHLHPDDALDELHNIYKALVPGGRYVCVTPNRLNGPHDISRGFDEIATGLHLKEYTISELHDIFREAGFRKVFSLFGARGYNVRTPISFNLLCEKVIEKIPYFLRNDFANSLIGRILLSIKLIGVK